MRIRDNNHLPRCSYLEALAYKTQWCYEVSQHKATFIFSFNQIAKCRQASSLKETFLTFCCAPVRMFSFKLIDAIYYIACDVMGKDNTAL